ncbi:MAG: ATP-binding cassette domain-containing protein [Flavobacteriales bacterium]|jgi:ABC-2 type transport system ATP-binding protein|nr:ATP-binding cassette domain-containing protein [Flavobacteriales bacterium]MBT6650885.1 ATP-binding cassette domain-containing protein [Flavobacteriales bacterium]MBT6964746.1 ATP-binding cassette domain-containing protein [Flavobacteriales bacterium]
MSLIINSVTKSYDKQQALADVSFTLNKGEIVGFLGPNGAGKSTLMKIITCYLQQDSGKVQVCNLDIQEQDLQVKAKIGYLPEHNPLYADMYVKEYLSFVGGIYKVENLNNRIAEIILQIGLIPEQSKKIGELSKGYRQRVGLAAALLHNPEVLILDEPTTGLDPNQLVEIRNLIKEVGKDKTVLLSTHIMQEVDKMCNRVIIISKGKIVDDQLISNFQNNKIDLEEHFRKLTA